MKKKGEKEEYQWSSTAFGGGRKREKRNGLHSSYYHQRGSKDAWERGLSPSPCAKLQRDKKRGGKKKKDGFLVIGRVKEIIREKRLKDSPGLPGKRGGKPFTLWLMLRLS